MSDIAVRAEGLGKEYHIGSMREHHRTWGQSVRGALATPVRRLRRILAGQAATDHSDTMWALRDISFEVKQGEVVGIIGRNGAGKSTLLKILSRITEPTTGYAEVHGRVGSLLEVGTGFHPELTGQENIFLNGAILGMSRRDIARKFDEIVAFAEVEKFIYTPVKHYSSGMYLRLAFAVAAHLEPEILVVDEVLAVGDASFQQKCLGKMGSVASEGRTVLFVSHNMAAVENLCDRAILLRNGEIYQDGETNEVLHTYLGGLTELGNSSLAERTERDGRGEIRIVAIDVFNHREEPLDFVASGQEVVVRVRLHSATDRVFGNCRLTLVFARDGQTSFVVSTAMASSDVLDLRGGDWVDFTIPAFPLVGGRYLVDAHLTAGLEAQDAVWAATEVSVVDGDFFGTGRTAPMKGWKSMGVLVKHDYRLGAATPATVGG